MVFRCFGPRSLALQGVWWGRIEKKKSRKKEVKKGGFEPLSLKVSLMRLGYAQREREKMPLLYPTLSWQGFSGKNRRTISKSGIIQPYSTPFPLPAVQKAFTHLPANIQREHKRP